MDLVLSLSQDALGLIQLALMVQDYLVLNQIVFVILDLALELGFQPFQIADFLLHLFFLLLMREPKLLVSFFFKSKLL